MTAFFGVKMMFLTNCLWCRGAVGLMICTTIDISDQWYIGLLIYRTSYLSVQLIRRTNNCRPIEMTPVFIDYFYVSQQTQIHVKLIHCFICFSSVTFGLKNHWRHSSVIHSFLFSTSKLFHFMSVYAINSVNFRFADDAPITQALGLFWPPVIFFICSSSVCFESSYTA